MAEIINKLISIIIPVYNRPQLLREAVESARAQPYSPIEIIISNDGSTDETADVARKLSEECPEEIRFIRNNHRGSGPAREAGRQIAKGEFIQYLDSDNLLSPRKFKIQVDALHKNTKCCVAYGRSRLLSIEGKVFADPFKWIGMQFPTLLPCLLVDRWWCTHTPL